MIIKYLTTTPTYESPSIPEDTITNQVALEEVLSLYHEHCHMPLIQQAVDILTITPKAMRQLTWHYIDNIKKISTFEGYVEEFGNGIHVNANFISGENIDYSFTDTAYLLNDSGKTIEMISRGTFTHYDSHKVSILKRFIDGEYNREKLFEELDKYYSEKKENKNSKN